MAEILALEPHFLQNIWSDLVSIFLFVILLLFILIIVSANKWSEKVTERIIFGLAFFIVFVSLLQVSVLADKVSKELRVTVLIKERGMKNEPIIAIEPVKEDDLEAKGYLDIELENNKTMTIHLNDVHETNTTDEAFFLTYYEVTEEEYTHMVETLDLSIDGLTNKGLELTLHLTEKDYDKWREINENED